MALSNGKAFPPQARGYRVFLALGTNLGDRQAHLIQALQYIKSRISLENVSPFYETDPVGYTAQPLFLNAVCEGYTSLSPQDLLASEFYFRPPFATAPGSSTWICSFTTTSS